MPGVERKASLKLEYPSINSPDTYIYSYAHVTEYLLDYTIIVIRDKTYNKYISAYKYVHQIAFHDFVNINKFTTCGISSDLMYILPLKFR